MDRKEHWERIYQTKEATEVSWFQPQPTLSIRLLESAGLGPST
jgi:hypothetical protein